MTKDKKQDGLVTSKDVAATVGAAGAGVAVALGVNPASSPGVLASAAVLAAVFPAVLATMTEASLRMMKGRAERFFEKLVSEWARDADKTPQEIANLLAEAKEDPVVSDTIWRAVRGLMEAPNNAAAVSLGVLTAEYLRDKRPADAFFRGTVRLLHELEVTEASELQSLLSWVLSTTKRNEVELVARLGAVDTTLDEFMNDAEVYEKPNKRSRISLTSDVERLFALLTGNGLAVSYAGIRFGSGFPQITVRRSTVERLLRVLSTK